MEVVEKTKKYNKGLLVNKLTSTPTWTLEQ